MTDPMELVGLVEGRIGQDFDGECHLTADEARQIAHLIIVVREGSVEIGNRTEAPLLMRTSLSSPAPDVERGEG